MDRIKSWYNQNRLKIFLGLLVVVVVGILVYKLISGISTNDTKDADNTVSDINTNTFNSVVMPTKKSIVTGDEITTTQKEITVVDDFMSYCNSGKLQEAYNLISNECKDELYPSFNEFQKNYYTANFNGQKKNIKIENWNENIYKVTINEDALATGKYNANNTLQDYITIVKDNENNPKININSYIGRKIINKTESSNGVDINIIQRDTYMDYEYYTFEIKNGANTILQLSDIDDMNSTYLEDENNMKYQAYMYELTEDDLKVYAGETKKVKIKYFNPYSSTRKIKSLVFLNLKLSGYSNYTTIKIDM